MGLLSILGKGLQAMINEALTPESFKVGEKFEDRLKIQSCYITHINMTNIMLRGMIFEVIL